jgi:hypothetical protein
MAWDNSRQLTCFENCRRSKDCLTGFDHDDRPECATGILGEEPQGIICLMPADDGVHDAGCENYVHPDAYCFDTHFNICINWRVILIASLIANCLQVVFEASMLYALEITMKPTYLDKLQQPDDLEDE